MKKGVVLFLVGVAVGEFDPVGWAAWQVIGARLPAIKAASLAAPSPFESLPRSRWIAESANAFAIVNEEAPVALVHLLVIPKHRYTSLLEPAPELLGEMLALARTAAAERGIAESGFRVIVNTNPQGAQTVYHLHMHVIGGTQVTEPLMPLLWGYFVRGRA